MYRYLQPDVKILKTKGLKYSWLHDNRVAFALMRCGICTTLRLYYKTIKSTVGN